MTAWLVIAKPVDGTGTVKEQRFSAGLATPFVVGARECIEQLPDVAMEAMTQGFGAAGSSAQPGSLQLLNEDGRLSGLLALSWDDAEVEIYRAADGAAVAGIDDMTLSYKLRGAAATTSDHSIVVAMKNVSGALDVALSLPRFAGTGGIEGPAELANQPKPCALGPQTSYEGRWVDRSLWIMMLHFRAIDSVSLVTDRGVALTAGGDYDTYAELAAADLSASTHDGKYYTCLADGCIRLARKPQGVVVADFKGDAGDDGDSYVDRPGALMTRIVADLWDGDGITVNAAAMAALDAAFDYPLKLASKDGSERVSDWLETVAVSAGALWWVDRLAALKAKLFAFGGAAAEIADWRATRPERQGAWPRWNRIVLGYRTIGRIHSNDELAEVAVAGQNAAGTLALEINIDASGASSPGEGILYGFSGETPDRSVTGSFVFGGAKITVPYEYAPPTPALSFLTSNTGKGFICFDTAQTTPFSIEPAAVALAMNCAFVRNSGGQWQYDNNENHWVTFTPPATMVGLGYLYCDAAGHIAYGGLFGEAMPLELAAFPAADVTDYDSTLPFTPVTNGAAGTVRGTTFTKVDGTAGAWDRQVYSREAFQGGVFVSFVPVAGSVMIGINGGSPGDDAGYATIDRALLAHSNGRVYIYEDGNDRGEVGSWVSGQTTLAVVYDGPATRYYVNGALVRPLIELSAEYSFYLDSSLYDLGAQARAVNFGPYGKYPGGALADKDTVNTGDMDPNNAVDIAALVPGFAPVYITEDLTESPEFSPGIAGAVLRNETTAKVLDGHFVTISGSCKLRFTNGSILGVADACYAQVYSKTGSGGWVGVSGASVSISSVGSTGYQTLVFPNVIAGPFSGSVKFGLWCGTSGNDPSHYGRSDDSRLQVIGMVST
jgi:hypothetical protein